MCISQNKRPHFLQLMLPTIGPKLLPHAGSVHLSLLDVRCQCFLVTSSSGSMTVSKGGREPDMLGGAVIGCVSLDSKTSRPRNFELIKDSGWKRFALRTCLSNHVLTSSCWISGSSW